MNDSRRMEVTALLADWGAGDDRALERLTALIYGELRSLAEIKMHRERAHHTLRPTEVVHEAFVRLLGQRVQWQNRAHFLGVAGHAMRRVLLDHGRKRNAEKRPSSNQRVTLTGLAITSPEDLVDPLDLEAALCELAEVDPRAVQVFELRCFAGCTAAEAATALDISEATVARDWRMGRAWLRRRLGPLAAGDGPRGHEATT